MNKRNKKALMSAVGLFAVVLLTSLILLTLITGGRKQIVAAELDVIHALSLEDDRSAEINEAVQYFERNGINTVIVKVNSGDKSIVQLPEFEYVYKDFEKLDGEDTAEQLEKAFRKEKISLYLSLDCSGISDEMLLAAVEYLSDKYKTDGFVIDNFDGDDSQLREIKKILNKGFRNTDFIFQTDDAGKIRTVSELKLADMFIAENIGAQDYSELKGEVKKDILLHYSAPSMESDVFLLSNFSSVDGAVITDYDKDRIAPYRLDTIFKEKVKLPSFNFKVSNDFSVTYPSEDMATYYSGMFITGTGEPYGTVVLNGNEYTAEKDGTFGIYYDLVEGDNQLSISQGDKTEHITVTRKVYRYTGEKYETPWDDTQKVHEGQIVQTVNELTSMLSDPDSDSAIIAGMEKGTKLKVVDTEETVRSGKKTYAYQLSNGAYVLAGNVEVLNEISADCYAEEKADEDDEDIFDFSEFDIYEAPVIRAATVEETGDGDEILKIKVNSRPAVLSTFGEDSLLLHFLDAEIEDFELPQSSFYTHHRIFQKDDGAYIELRLNTENMLWGYDIKVNDSDVEIYLKQSPKHREGDKPLKGVTIMLDAGHGGKDSGALGVASMQGPLEKDLNLAVAQSTKALLEEYGADVVMTRDDDSFPTLDDRRNYIREIKPDLFIAVHHNSMDYSYNSTTVRGSECYYFTKQSKELARLLCENITAATGRRNRGAKLSNYYVTRTDIAPSALMEYSFIINPGDFSSTYTDTDIYRAAFGTLKAVLKAIPT